MCARKKARGKGEGPAQKQTEHPPPPTNGETSAAEKGAGGGGGASDKKRGEKQWGDIEKLKLLNGMTKTGTPDILQSGIVRAIRCARNEP